MHISLKMLDRLTKKRPVNGSSAAGNVLMDMKDSRGKWQDFLKLTGGIC